MHAEVRGRRRSWKVWVPDAGQMAHTVPVYDQEGDFKETILVGSPPGDKGIRYVECYGGPFASVEEATEYAEYLGYTEIRVSKTKTQNESLALARAARQR